MKTIKLKSILAYIRKHNIPCVVRETDDGTFFTFENSNVRERFLYYFERKGCLMRSTANYEDSYFLCN